MEGWNEALYHKIRGKRPAIRGGMAANQLVWQELLFLAQKDKNIAPCGNRELSVLLLDPAAIRFLRWGEPVTVINANDTRIMYLPTTWPNLNICASWFIVGTRLNRCCHRYASFHVTRFCDCSYRCLMANSSYRCPSIIYHYK